MHLVFESSILFREKCSLVAEAPVVALLVLQLCNFMVSVSLGKFVKFSEAILLTQPAVAQVDVHT